MVENDLSQVLEKFQIPFNFRMRSLELLAEDTQVETQSNSLKLKPVFYECTI